MNIIEAIYFENNSLKVNQTFANTQRYIKVTDATVEPVTVSEMKQQLIIDASFTDDDVLIETYIKAARLQAERMLGFSLITSVWSEKLMCFPSSSEIWLSVGNVQSIESITYTDADGNIQTWSNDQYILDNSGSLARVTLAYNASYPITRHQANSVNITYKSGYGDTAADVPVVLQQAVRLIAADYYENRVDGLKGIPRASDAILKSYSCSQMI